MLHDLLRSSSFFYFLLLVDRHIADQARSGRCPFCGAPLDTAHFARKPRGAGLGMDEDLSLRFSFCCRADGCRRRVTPASVRFLGRRVYLSVAVTLATAMLQGLTPARISTLCRELGADWHTIRDWKRWWREAFPSSLHFQKMRGLLATPLNPRAALADLWRRIVGTAYHVETHALEILQFLVFVTPQVPSLSEKIVRQLLEIAFPQKTPTAGASAVS